jgi:hypothetical protein
MTEIARNKISAFLAQYVEMDGANPIPDSNSDFISAIELLIRERIFDGKSDLRRECLYQQGVIIPDYLFGVYQKSDRV